MKRAVTLLALLVLVLFQGSSAGAQATGAAGQDAAAAGQAPAGAQAADGSSQEVHYPDHFRVFTGRGEPATLEDLVRAMAGAEAVLIGEIHTDPVGHWVQTELLRLALTAFKVGDEEGAFRHLALSKEMFERDVQGVVDEYLQDLITERLFKTAARAPRHYDEDYRPMVEMAKEANIPVIASNAPRRYVNRVSRLGRNALYDLPPRARSFLPPLPYPQPSDAYRQEWVTLMTEMPMEQQCDPPPGAEVDREAPHGAAGTERTDSASRTARHPETLPRVGMPTAAEAPAGMGAMSHMGSFMENGVHAQSLWDASMAYSITTFLEVNPGALVLHMVGGFHVRGFTGIPEAIRYYRPSTRTLVISMELADDFQTFDPQEHGGSGDFVVLTDRSLDLGYVRNCLEGGIGG